MVLFTSRPQTDENCDSISNTKYYRIGTWKYKTPKFKFSGWEIDKNQDVKWADQTQKRDRRKKNKLCIDINSICCTSEANIMLCVNYTSIKSLIVSQFKNYRNKD